MYVVLLLDEGRETKAQKIEVRQNIISIREILKSFGVEKINPEEKIWIKRLNFDEFRKEAYGLNAMLEWDKFHGCEIAISPSRPEKPQAQTATSEKPKSAEDSGSSRNSSKRKALEEMLIMNIVLENQKNHK